MDLKDQLKQLGDRVEKLKHQIQTEEATKNALIMPFIQYLGYDVFNPLEVVPEFVSDIGLKKGEKIDYAILKEGVPTILVECKHWAQNLNIHDGQLLRYFHVSKAKFGILTNGINYRFYSDLVEPNKMDEKPFLEFNINDLYQSPRSVSLDLNNSEILFIFFHSNNFSEKDRNLYFDQIETLYDLVKKFGNQSLDAIEEQIIFTSINSPRKVGLSLIKKQD